MVGNWWWGIGCTLLLFWRVGSRVGRFDKRCNDYAIMPPSWFSDFLFGWERVYKLDHCIFAVSGLWGNYFPYRRVKFST
ncbi:uncharacterized protein K452DRAFT_136479 [Aplosporella prunicola CBS 121167]|uniref:Secreted protein n=1 Tax=Aplosporella prunicola CBS 121167 TaxID=1176127 RepID=A0A6A6BM70_9PEZI|nr:uncharacterized protein K452DRAFT_136479 [Aplosporella prunicola CBS 121167]KAF2145219.1 hypothetical protein K452DRAFT_136479 [Aplosporella prunicola CBS 121167]